MVDFNNETTVTRPATEIESILILQCRDNVLEAAEKCSEDARKGVTPKLAVLGARIERLYWQLVSFLKERLNGEDYAFVMGCLDTKVRLDYYRLMAIYEIISDELRKVNLTKFDTRKQLGFNIVERNKSRGLD